ncbi:MAG: transposase family protein [Planctomycetes bacterium]|nr:transposase family protein [Planctomycetota bacterium]MBU4398310.1 transposase family protein [Planctomycetota bacterium]MCG2684661.1 transposase family protein [Planctomycetales bacterium]
MVETLLARQPAPDQTALPTAAALKSLFDQHGPPLLAKSDNGSAFKSRDLGEFLTQYGASPATFPAPHALVQWRLLYSSTPYRRNVYVERRSRR